MAAYQNNFVATIKHNGKPLREINQNGKRVCILKHNSEYSIYLKNLTNKRCKVQIEIDGTDVLFGNTLLLKPNERLTLKRFLESNTEGKRFKFVSINTAAKAGELQDPEEPLNGNIKIKVFWEIKPYMFMEGTDIYSTSTQTSDASYMPWHYTTNNSENNLRCASNNAGNIRGVTIGGGISKQAFHEASDINTNFHADTIIDIWLQSPKNESDYNLNPVAESILNTYILPALEQDSSFLQRQKAKEWLTPFIASINKK